MKKQSLAKKLLGGLLAFATVLTVGTSISAKVVKPGKVVVKSVSAFLAEDGDARGLEYTWKKISGAKGYQYRYHPFWTKKSTAKDFQTGLAKKTSIQISIQDNADICFQVRAYKLNTKGKKVFGTWSSKKVLKANTVETMFQELSSDEYDFSEAHKKDLERYASKYSTLKDGQYYAFADINEEFDALVVTDSVYDYGEGGRASIKATIYGFNKDNEIVEFGTVESSGTSYPLSVNNGCLYCGGGHFIKKVYADKETASIVVKEEAGEEFDADGNATYYYTGSDGSRQKQTDDSEQKRILSELEESVVLNFFPVKK